MDSLGTIGIFLLAAFIFLAFWKMNSILFMILAAISIMLGLEAPDIISGTSTSTPTGFTIGIMLIVFSFACAGIAYRLMFWREPVDDAGGEE